MKARFLIPFALFAVLIYFFFVGLSLNPREIPSPLVNKPAPPFNLPQLHEPSKNLGVEDMRGKVWIFNVWASWCVSCREEHPLWVAFARNNSLPIVGLNYKDKRPEALNWLLQLGNPYVVSVMDSEGRTGIDYGVYGVPETYVIDRQGIIRMKHIGPINEVVLQAKILPMVKELSK